MKRPGIMETLKTEYNVTGTLVGYCRFDRNREMDGGELKVRIFQSRHYNGGASVDYDSFAYGVFESFEISIRIYTTTHSTSQIDVTGRVNFRNYELFGKLFSFVETKLNKQLPNNNFLQQILFLLGHMGIETIVMPKDGRLQAFHGQQGMYSAMKYAILEAIPYKGNI